MKKIIFTAILLSMLLSAQTTAQIDYTVTSERIWLPEVSALMEIRDRLKEKNADTLLIQWYDYQIWQWLNGIEVKRCVYQDESNNIYIAKCPRPETVTINQYVKDTIVYVPLPISFEGFMNWRVSVALKD